MTMCDMTCNTMGAIIVKSTHASFCLKLLGQSSFALVMHDDLY